MHLIFGVVLVFGIHAAVMAAHYTIEELPALEPNVHAEVMGLDERGHLLGTTFNPTNYQYGNFALKNGAWRTIHLTNFEYHVFDVNREGVVLGNILQLQMQPYRIRPFLWRPGMVEELHLFTNDYVVAWSINDKGEIVGEHSLNHFPFNTKPFLYSRGRVETLKIPEATSATAKQINNRGEILINAQKPPRYWMLVREANRNYRQVNVPSARQVVGVAINNRGSVAGVFTFTDYGTQHAFLYRKGRVIDIEPPDATSSSAVAINDRDEVLGTWANGAHASGFFVYRDGIWQDLTHRLRHAAGQDGWEILSATGINDAGEIAGMGNRDGRRVPYLLKRSK